MRRKVLALCAAIALDMYAGNALAEAPPADASRITTPQAMLGGHVPGEDYFLANYSQLAAYMQKVASESDRMKLVDIGPTAEGRRQYMLVISSPENIRNLDKYKDIAARLARADGLGEQEAHKLAHEGKSVIWISSGMHSFETTTTQAMFMQVYKAATDNDPEWRRILDDTVLLLGHANPDGTELVANWYMRNPDPTKRIGGASTVAGPLNATPQLFHKYVGHDDNRDYLIMAQPESENVAKVCFREWYPQIIYDHHQAGPAGAVVFLPPFRDPFNYDLDPLSISELGELGNSIHSRLIEENKPGSTMRSGSNYSTWFNGALRTTTYFHNTLGVLSEIIGNATPMPVPLIPANQLPHNDLPLPVPPQTWHLRQSVDYELSINRAVLDYASRNRERLLFNIYRMASNSIKRGSEDNWTISASRVRALADAAQGAPKVAGGTDPSLYDKILHDPVNRDPRGYIIPADQADFPNAIGLMNALIKSGVVVERATAGFTVAGKTYPAGSYVVQAAQAYRPVVLDSFEAQDHPMDLVYPGGPPQRPYDLTGYTLAFQMGVKFDRVFDGFTGPFVPVREVIAPPPGSIRGSAKAGYLIDHKVNNAEKLTYQLLKAKVPVYWLKDGITASGKSFAPGAIWVPASLGARKVLEADTAAFGVDAYGQDMAPAGGRFALRAPRIGLVDVYFGSMPSGWIRWLMDQYGISYTKIFPQRLDAGHLKKDFDVIIMPDAIGVSDRSGQGSGAGNAPQPSAADIPSQYAGWLGHITKDKTAPQLEEFVKDGGSLMAIGNSAGVASMLGIPVDDVTTQTVDGKVRALPNTKFYIPGSLLTMRVDTSNPLAYGEDDVVDTSYDNNPSFKFDAPDLQPVASFKDDKLLASGWAIGQDLLKGSSPIVDAKIGKGHVFLMGVQVTERGQPSGSFKFFFNGLYYSTAVSE